MKDSDDSDEDYMTVALMETLFTPQQAAGILAKNAALRLSLGSEDRALAELFSADSHHKVFVACLNVIARRA